MTTSTRRRAKGERTQASILAAAEARFSELGFRETRLEDVAEDVGLGRSGVLYHFADKRQLYRAVLDDLFGGLLGELLAAIAGSGTLAERLEASVAAFVDCMARRPSAARIFIREAVNSDASIREEIRAHVRPFLALLERVFEEGEQIGSFRPTRSDPLHFVSTVAGATLFYIAALPTFVSDLPYDLLAPAQLEAHKRDVLDITRRLLGIHGPRPVAERTEPNERRRP